MKVTDEAAGLRDKLVEAREEKWEAMRKMETAQVENELLQGWMTELGGQQTAYKVCSARTYFIFYTILQLQSLFGSIVYEPGRTTCRV